MLSPVLTGVTVRAPVAARASRSMTPEVERVLDVVLHLRLLLEDAPAGAHVPLRLVATASRPRPGATFLSML